MKLNNEFIGQIIDMFEDFLEARGVTLHNDEREQDEDAAIIYGTDYSELHEGIADTLTNWNIPYEDGWGDPDNDEQDKPKRKVTIPCDVCVKRYYRAYVEVDEDTSGSEIIKKMNAEILEQQDDALTPDPDLEIEDQDIVYVEPDWDAVWYD